MHIMHACSSMQLKLLGWMDIYTQQLTRVLLQLTICTCMHIVCRSIDIATANMIIPVNSPIYLAIIFFLNCKHQTSQTLITKGN